MSQARTFRVAPAVAFIVAGVFCAAASGTGARTLDRNAADQAVARDAVLHLGDFAPGSGWVSVPPPDSSGSSGGGACGSATDSAGLVETGHAVSAFEAPGFY